MAPHHTNALGSSKPIPKVRHMLYSNSTLVYVVNSRMSWGWGGEGSDMGIIFQWPFFLPFFFHACSLSPLFVTSKDSGIRFQWSIHPLFLSFLNALCISYHLAFSK